MMRMMVFTALAGLAVPDGLAQTGQKVPDRQASFADSPRAVEPGSLLLAQNTTNAKDAAIPQRPKSAKSISEDDAKQIAEKAVPGKAIDVAIEKKRGANRFVVEVAPTAGGKEVDVIIDMANGKVLGIEK